MARLLILALSFAVGLSSSLPSFAQTRFFGVPNSAPGVVSTTPGIIVLYPRGSSQDDTANIQSLINQSATYAFRLGPGTFYTTGLTINSNQSLIGSGKTKTTLFLIASSNETVITATNFAANTGHANVQSAAPDSVEISEMLIDGNKANNTGAASGHGHGIAYYGRRLTIRNVYIQNTYRTGLWTEYGTPGSCSGCTSPWDGHLVSVTIDSPGEHGWRNDYSDIHATDMNIRNAGSKTTNTYSSVYLGSQGGTAHVFGLNTWTSSGTTSYPQYSIFADGGSSTFTNVSLENGCTANLYLHSNLNNVSNMYAYNLNATCSAVVVGNVLIAGGGNVVSGVSSVGTGYATTYGLAFANSASGNQLNIRISSFTAGVINWTNEGTNNTVIGSNFQASGTSHTGSPAATDNVLLTGYGGVGYTLTQTQ